VKIALVYNSKTGNTEELVQILFRLFLKKNIDVALYRIEQFPLMELSQFDGFVLGTYTWGDGEIPFEMIDLYHELEIQDVKHMITGIVGTGDSGYPKFCGAVDEFRDMLYVQTKLAVTLKVELSPQRQDIERCKRFVGIFMDRLVEMRST
jgi:flavodoxin I